MKQLVVVIFASFVVGGVRVNGVGCNVNVANFANVVVGVLQQQCFILNFKY